MDSGQGFPVRHNCMVLLVDEVLKAMDSHQQVDLPLLDYPKAFDTLLKLEHYGIQSNTHQWIATWLTTRIQKVIVEERDLKITRMLSGVPQETVLGSLSFCCILMTLTQTFGHLSTFC